MEEGIHVAISAEKLGEFFGIPITNTLITSWVVIAILVGLAFLVRGRLAMIPGRLQTLLEEAFVFVYDYVAETLESRDMARKSFSKPYRVCRRFYRAHRRISARYFALLPSFREHPRRRDNHRRRRVLRALPSPCASHGLRDIHRISPSGDFRAFDPFLHQTRHRGTRTRSALISPL